MLLEHEVNVDAFSLYGKHKGECTTLMVASEHRHTKIVELLLRYKACVDTETVVAGPDEDRLHSFKGLVLIKCGSEMLMGARGDVDLYKATPSQSLVSGHTNCLKYTRAGGWLGL